MGLNGVRVGDYELLEELARGGMGVVYRARDCRLDRVVALKMILAGGFASDEERRRFANEAATAARLRHPAIVPIFEAGQQGDQPYFVMAYIAGTTLAQRLSQGALPPGEAVRLIRILAEAVHYAHLQGVVHRDLKPANILLDSDGQPHIADFGLAKQSGLAGELTDVGRIIGTPAYMSPEQATGQSDQVGSAADVYSLGAVLYHALTGQPPFQAACAADIIPQVREDEPVSPRRIDHRIPRDLEIVCLKCLRKEPLQRYASAQRLAADLRRIETGEPIEARPVSNWERGWRICLRHPAVSLAIAAAVLSLVGGTAVSIRLARQADRARKSAEQAAEVARQERDRASQSALAASRSAYAASLKLAQVAWEAGDIRHARELLEPWDSVAPDQRGWEWYYQRRLLQPPTVRLQRDPGVLFSLAWSPDGGQIAAGTARGVGLWDGQGESATHIPLGEDLVSEVAYSRDSRRLVAVSLDGWVMEIDPATRQPTASRPISGGAFTAVTISNDGQTILCGSGVGAVFRFTGGGLESVWTVESQDGAITSLSLDPAGERFAVGRNTGVIEVHALRDGGLQQRIDQPMPHPCRVRFLADSLRIVATAGEGDLRVWDVDSGVCTAVLHGHAGPVHAVALSADDQTLVTGGNDGTVRTWRLADLTPQVVLRGHEFAVRSVAASREGTRIVSSGLDAVTQIWTTRQPAGAQALQRGSTPIRSLVPLSRHSAVLAGAPDGSLSWTSLPMDQPVLSGGEYRKSASDPFSGRALAVDATETLAWLIDGSGIRARPITTLVPPSRGGPSPESELLVSAEELLSAPPSALVLLPDEQLAFSRAGGRIEVWDRNDRRRVREWATGSEQVYALAVAPGRRRLVSAGPETTVRQWSLADGKELTPFLGQSSYVLCLAFHPDETLLASGGWDGSIILWNTDDERRTLILSGHRERVNSVHFSPDGARLVSVSADGTIKFWDTASGHELYSLSPGLGVLNSVRFAADGDLVVVGSEEGTLGVFGEAGLRRLLRAGTSRSEEPLGEADWNRILDSSYSFGWTGGISNAQDETRSTYYRLHSLQRQGDELYGAYDWQAGTIRGRLAGRVFDGVWIQRNGRGALHLTFDDDFREATGWWNEGGNTPRRAAILRPENSRKTPPGE